MWSRTLLGAALVALSAWWGAIDASAAGDPAAGAQGFAACAACHSLEPGRQMTGPSLAGIYGRKAGTVEGFARYSPALRGAGVTWNDETLNAWLADSRGFIPGSRMTFPGIKDAQARADLIAFLAHSAAEGEAAGGEGGQGGQGGQAGTMGGMMSSDVPPLKEVGPAQQVTAIRYCGDTYQITTADGQTQPFWERNLRFKTDSSAEGPAQGHPALMPAGMMGDRASIIFATPTEISALIESKC